MMNSGWFSRWKAHRRDIERYPMTNDRSISYSMGLQYLQAGPATVIDVGCGFSDFASHVQQKNPMAVTNCLDGNLDTVEALRKQGYNLQLYRAPERLPFNDGEIAFVHCSHLIEHLQPQELYLLLQEFDRVLRDQGVLVISSPTLWEGFYNDLSHIRPYPPEVLDKYLSSTVEKISGTRKHIKQFRSEALFYRYKKCSIFSKLGLRAHPWIPDLIILGSKKAAEAMGIYRLVTTGYTAIYRKVRRRME